MLLERLLNEALGGRSTRRASKPKTQWVAVFPDGTEVEVKRRIERGGTSFSLTTPDGNRWISTVLRDLKWSIDSEFSGTKFERRSI
jgi:hypothetical protein